jgi:IS1 family transposase
MANVLPRETRNTIMHLLTEGNSVRAVERLTGVAKSTILRLAVTVGEGCERLHNLMVRGVIAEQIECDEQWSFVQKKQARVTEKDAAGNGDAWTFVALDRDSKLCISYLVGKRDQEATNAFMADLRTRLLVAPQVSTDGFGAYAQAVGESFGGAVDYGQVVKQYGYNRTPDYKYAQTRGSKFIKKTTIIGAPAIGDINTSRVERFNLSTRHTDGRVRRLCLAFSKTLRGHSAAIALTFAAYNLVRIHGSLRVTPGMAAGITDHVWDIAEIVDAALAAPAAGKPVKHDLLPREGTGPVRALPDGRGFLRLVTGSAPPAKGKPGPTPEPSPVAPAVAPAVLHEAPREPVQLSLFGED